MTRYRLHGVLPVLLGVDGRAGLWSPDKKAAANFVFLEPEQMLLLMQFMRPCTPDEAFERAGLSQRLGSMLLAPLLSLGYVREDTGTEEPYHRFDRARPGSPPPFLVELDALAPDLCRAVQEQAMSPDLVGSNQLSDGFVGTRGFGIKFRREAIPRVVSWFPGFAPFLDAALDPAVHEALAPDAADAADAAHRPAPNAFYLNVLIVPPGQGTARHIDASLGDTATYVSVLYLQVCEPAGGQLHLFDHGLPVGIVNPREGMLVHFRGDLEHGVSSRSPGASGDRISLICEHFTLAPDLLAACPFLAIDRR